MVVGADELGLPLAVEVAEGVRGVPQRWPARCATYWGDASFGLRDLDGERLPELSRTDDRFRLYAFTSYAGSALPVQVWRYRAGH